MQTITTMSDLTFLGSSADLLALRIQGCTALPCTLRRGETYVIDIDAISSEYPFCF